MQTRSSLISGVWWRPPDYSKPRADACLDPPRLLDELRRCVREAILIASTSSENSPVFRADGSDRQRHHRRPAFLPCSRRTCNGARLDDACSPGQQIQRKSAWFPAISARPCAVRKFRQLQILRVSVALRRKRPAQNGVLNHDFSSRSDPGAYRPGQPFS